MLDPPPEPKHPDSPSTAIGSVSRTVAFERCDRRRASLTDRGQGRLRAACLIVLAALLAAFAGCGSGGSSSSTSATESTGTTQTSTTNSSSTGSAGGVTLLPGMPPPLQPNDVYAADRPNQLSPTVREFPSRIYVPNSESNTVSVIDPKSYKVINTFPVDQLPQHVVPSYDLKTLWVTNDEGNTLTPIDPANSKPGKPVPVEDPYNMYFTPDGKRAIAVAERLQRLDFLEPRTMKLQHALKVDCPGVDHMDFTPDGRYLLASCEFGGSLIKVDVARQKVVGSISLKSHSDMPQDVKLSADGKTFYVADMAEGGVWTIDAKTFKRVGFLPTGAGAHGIYVSRDSKTLYVSNREAGTVSLVSLAKRKVVDTWQLPAGSSPDMGGVSADGKVLWLSGRYDSAVYAIDTSSGKLLARIPVGSGPHGLSVYPQPGRYSLGHTGVFR